MAIALDTLAYARRLREAGFSEQQAEGQARALASAMTDSLATKQDLREHALAQQVAMDACFAQVDRRFAEIDARFAQVDARFAQVDARIDALEKHLDTRFAELEKRFEIRLEELEKRIEVRFGRQEAHLDGRFADLERRMTLRLGGMVVAGIGAASALVKLL